MKNYYQILEIASDASQDVIKEQYRFLVHAWHPDKFSNSTQKIKAEEKLKEINEAYAVLNNPIKRAAYDNSLLASHTDQEQENRKQKEAQSTGRRAETTPHAKEEPSRKERARTERDEAERSTLPAITVGEVIRAWKQISSSLLGESIHMAALLNSVKMIQLEGNTLVLGFASEVVRSKMKTKEIERTRKAIYDMLGVKLDVRSVVVQSHNKPHSR
jgi:curved DNA-binding protein CbpA